MEKIISRPECVFLLRRVRGDSSVALTAADVSKIMVALQVSIEADPWGPFTEDYKRLLVRLRCL